MAMSDVTRTLSQIEQVDPQAADELLPLVYEELRRLASAKLADGKPGQTSQATALVREAYVRLLGAGERATGDGGQGTGDRRGIAAGISLGRRRRRCGEFWSSGPAARSGIGAAEICGGWTSRTWMSFRRSRPINWWRS